MADLNAIAKKWQQRWEQAQAFKFDERSTKPKFYCLEMFPYPSGYGLHMGHARNYSMGDSVARFKRMQGYNVLYPMGYDAFGLPAENAAIKNKTHPAVYTENSMAAFTRQLKELGNSYDWSRTLATCYPEYYKWNQWFFLQFYKRGLAYKKKAPVNWCTKCNTVLANEQVVGGKCWRHEDTAVEQRELEQWFFRITEYADELLAAIKEMDGWPEKIRIMQENWIGRSEGTNIDFQLEGSDQKLTAFTTRIDTIFSVTFIVMAPEHPLVMELVKGTEYEAEVARVVKEISQQSIIERTTAEGKDKIGAFLGKHVINPVNGERIPVYVANFALMYGTGIVMADAHDERDFEFARKYDIPLKFVISPDGKPLDASAASEAYTQDGILFASGKWSGMHNREALPKMAEWIEEQGWGKRTINYKIRDWLISRQRYWGTPIPMVYCDKCGIVPVPEEQLPVTLPKDVEFTGQGNPLLTSHEFVHTTCPQCGGAARRETDTMDTFVDSSWYFLRYLDPQDKTKPFDTQQVNKFLPVDQYIGGAEHAVMHLLYARFFTRVLHDMGMVDIQEPFSHLFNQGIVTKDGAKMSKSLGNVVSQDEISSKYGIDTARLFLMFVASPASELEWSDEGAEGSYRFLNKVLGLAEDLSTRTPAGSTKDRLIESKRHKAVKMASAHLEQFELNKAIIEIMEFANAFHKHKEDLSDAEYRASLETLALLLLPFTPHLSEEIGELLGLHGFMSTRAWPVHDESLISERIELDEEYVAEIISNARKNVQLKGEKPSKITLYQAQGWKYDFVLCFRTAFERIKNPGQLTAELLKEERLTQHKDEVSKLAQAVFKNQKLLPLVDRTHREETELLAAAVEALRAEFGVDVVLGDPDTATESKAKNGLPGKPAIVLG